MRIAKLLTVLAVFIVLGGCQTMMGPPLGLVYSGVESNKQFDTASDGPPSGRLIVGESCTAGVLGIAAWGDAGLDAALMAAGHKGEPLKNVAVDHSFFNVFFFYYEYCTQVTAYVAQ